MKIVYRDKSITKPSLMYMDKTLIVLDWLLEFKYSTSDILSYRIELSLNSARRYFRTLVKNGLVRTFTNVHTMDYSYFMLTAAGVSMLESNGRDVSKAKTRVRALAMHSIVVHNIEVQRRLLSKLLNCSEVVWDQNIPKVIGEVRPDAIMTLLDGRKLALEYERYRKDKPRIFFCFRSHLNQIEQKYYSGILYGFDNDSDRNYYLKLFNQKEWPLYKLDSTKGRLKRLTYKFERHESDDLADKFVFN